MALTPFSGPTVRFDLLPGVALGVSGDRGIVDHFTREYGDAHAPARGSPVAVRIAFEASAAEPRGTTVAGGHKTVRWTVELGPPGGVLDAAVHLDGRPRWFARSLVQGYFVEPLIGIAAARAGHVLLPAAAFRTDAGATLVLGRSGAGKSSLTARAAAAGRTVWGDDQVFIDDAGGCRMMPRRMRLYPDIRLTAPTAWARLSVSARARLWARWVARLASGGYVAPSFPVAMSRIGARSPTGVPEPLSRVVVLDPSAHAPRIAARNASPAEVVDMALALLGEQRRHLASVGGSWGAELAATLDRERTVIGSGLRHVPVTVLTVPRVPRPASVIAEVASLLGVEP